MSLAQVKLDARTYLEEKDSKLQCMDFKGRVIVKHQDGTELKFENAIMEREYFGNFLLLLVWTEHWGSFFFFTEDLEKWYYTPYENSDPQERPEGEGRPGERQDDH
jgi:hypothetical protein